MEFTEFIQRKEEIEVALKPGLYIVAQNLPANQQAFRCGLAGKPRDSATDVQMKEGNFASRFATYLNYWLPSNAKVFACLTVPRRRLQGFTEKLLPERVEGDNRTDIQRSVEAGAGTLIQFREKQFHSNLVQLGMQRLGLPTTEDDRKRSEFFRGPLQTAIRALKDIGTGDLYIFEDGGKKIIKTVLKKRGIEELNPDLIPVRKGPERERNAPERFDPAVIYKTSPLLAQLLAEGDAITTNAINRLAQVEKVAPTTRKSPRLAGDEPLEIAMTPAQTRALRRGDPRMRNAVTRLQQLRRSPRLAQ